MGNVVEFAQRSTMSDPQHGLAIAVKAVLSSLEDSSRTVAAAVVSLDKSLRDVEMLEYQIDDAEVRDKLRLGSKSMRRELRLAMQKLLHASAPGENKVTLSDGQKRTVNSTMRRQPQDDH